MGQVPKNTILLIGDGHLACHLAFYLSHLNQTFSWWTRKRGLISYEVINKLKDHILSDNTSLNINKISDIQNFIDDYKNTTDIDIKLDLANLKKEAHSICFLAISDDNIDSFYKENFDLSINFVHFSGALYHKDILGIHPCGSFGENLFLINEYKNFPFICDQEILKTKNLCSFFPNKLYKISGDQKKLYHALLTLSGNFSNILANKLKLEFSDTFNFPKEVASFFLESTFKNIMKDNYYVTGPLTREDTNTLNAHIDSLKDDDFKEIYLAFFDIFITKRNRNAKYLGI